MNQYIGNLIIRIVLGVTFFAHGLAKFQSGIDNVAGSSLQASAYQVVLHTA